MIWIKVLKNLVRDSSSTASIIMLTEQLFMCEYIHSVYH